MKELLLEIIKEAQRGQVIIDNEFWPICFNTILKDNNQYQSYIQNDQFPILLLENIDEFLDDLEEYLQLELSLNRRHSKFYSDKERNLKKFLISYLFVNSTTEEFYNPNQMIKRKINFLKDKTLDNLSEIIPLENIPNSEIRITNKQDSVYMETPKKVELSITNNIDTYLLPSISYAIENNTCYIYSILNPRQEISTPYCKKIKRLLYKINSSTPEEYLNVSPSAVLSLSMFLKILKKYNIKKIKVLPYLPLRYLSREKLAKDNEILHERNDNIQTNATNKFIDTFLRLNYHEEIDIESYPYELDEYLNIKIKENSIVNNQFLEQINKKNTK